MQVCSRGMHTNRGRERLPNPTGTQWHNGQHGEITAQIDYSRKVKEMMMMMRNAMRECRGLRGCGGHFQTPIRAKVSDSASATISMHTPAQEFSQSALSLLFTSFAFVLFTVPLRLRSGLWPRWLRGSLCPTRKPKTAAHIQKDISECLLMLLFLSL